VKTPQQKLADLQGLYNEGLISESDYQAAKAKILSQIEQ
jgi:Short C-terminal domain